MYFEIQRHGEIDEKNFEVFLLNNSKILDIPIIATQEVFYLSEEMFEAHDALSLYRSKKFYR